MDVLPTARAQSWDDAEDVKDKEVPDASVLEKGSESDSHAPTTPPTATPMWKRVLAGGASDGNDTVRAMKGRHLTMIGAADLAHLAHRCAHTNVLQPSAARLAPASSSAQARHVISTVQIPPAAVLIRPVSPRPSPLPARQVPSCPTSPSGSSAMASLSRCASNTATPAAAFSHRLFLAVRWRRTSPSLVPSPSSAPGSSLPPSVLLSVCGA